MYFLFNLFSVQDEVEENTRFRVNLNIEEGGTLSKRIIFRFYMLSFWGCIHISGTFPSLCWISLPSCVVFQESLWAWWPKVKRAAVAVSDGRLCCFLVATQKIPGIFTELPTKKPPALWLND